MLRFYYPIQYGKWSFNWPWQLQGGLKSFVYRKWESENSNHISKWRGKIILGFKKIDIEWLISPEEAIIEWKKGQKRLFNYLIELSKEPVESNEDTRLFK